MAGQKRMPASRGSRQIWMQREPLKISTQTSHAGVTLPFGTLPPLMAARETGKGSLDANANKLAFEGIENWNTSGERPPPDLTNSTPASKLELEDISSQPSPSFSEPNELDSFQQASPVTPLEEEPHGKCKRQLNQIIDYIKQRPEHDALPSVVSASLEDDSDDYGDFEEQCIDQVANQLEYGRPSFDVDGSLVERLFPDNFSPSLISSVDEEAFTDISSRKAWYRISRTGTMKKHNTGEEDDFVRVNWKNSKIKSDVNNIVGKWISENTLHAGPSMVAGNKLSTIFGWAKSPKEELGVYHSLQKPTKQRKKGPDPALQMDIAPNSTSRYEPTTTTIQNKVFAVYKPAFSDRVPGFNQNDFENYLPESSLAEPMEPPNYPPAIQAPIDANINRSTSFPSIHHGQFSTVRPKRLPQRTVSDAGPSNQFPGVLGEDALTIQMKSDIWKTRIAKNPEQQFRPSRLHNGHKRTSGSLPGTAKPLPPLPPQSPDESTEFHSHTRFQGEYNSEFIARNNKSLPPQPLGRSQMMAQTVSSGYDDTNGVYGLSSVTQPPHFMTLSTSYGQAIVPIERTPPPTPPKSTPSATPIIHSPGSDISPLSRSSWHKRPPSLHVSAQSPINSDERLSKGDSSLSVLFKKSPVAAELYDPVPTCKMLDDEAVKQILLDIPDLSYMLL
ncbi:MAG: hypothetical protein M1829_000255 [Trizodia sp. TS-e1964]|nr:MAG: hypothetical protein M1829_000255 [Trizodia sp. TS-e1964]